MKPYVNKILLVDDDPDMNMITSHLIRKENLAEHIEIALNGEDALVLLKEKNHPDLILLDINMPLMNGWEFLDEYEKIDESIKRAIVVVMVTVSLNPVDKEQAKKRNVLLINKPLTSEALKKVIHYSVA